MSDFAEVPTCLYSWISQEDPLRITKCYQMKYWWHAFSDIFFSSNLQYIAGMFPSEDCWRRVNNLHGVKLDRQVIGKRIYLAPYKHRFERRFKLACRYCLEDEITDLMFDRRKTMSFEDIYNSVAITKTRTGTLKTDTLITFWLYLLDDRIMCLIRDLHVLEYGLQCALDMKQSQAMEFFWSKLMELPENEMSNQRKNEIIINCAVNTAQTCFSRPEIFGFVFSQIKPEKYSEFLEKEFRSTGCYKSLSILMHALRFEEFKVLFDYLMPNQISVDSYCYWIYYLGMNHLSGRYMDAAVGAFVHMWERTGFDKHRSHVHTELAFNTGFQTNLLVPLFSNGYTNLVWIILDRANPEQIEEYMESTNSDLIVDLLLQMKDNNSLYKFLTYRGRTVVSKNKFRSKKKTAKVGNWRKAYQF